MLGQVATLILPFSILICRWIFCQSCPIMRVLRLENTQNLVKRGKREHRQKYSSSLRKQHLIYFTSHGNHNHGADALPSSATRVTRGLACRRPSETNLSLAEPCRKQQAQEGGGTVCFLNDICLLVVERHHPLT